MVKPASSVKTDNRADIGHMSTGAGALPRIAYMVYAHQNLAQLVKLVSALDSPNARFIIHIDKKSKEYNGFTRQSSFQSLNNNNRVDFLEPRQNVNWGAYSLTDLSLRLLKKALEYPDITRFRSLSGADFPIQPTPVIEDILLRDEDHNFIQGFEPKNWRLEVRTRQYWMIDMLGAGRISHYLAYAQRLLGIDRKPPRGMTIIKGPQWWTLSRKAVEYILGFLEARPDVERFFRWSMVSDESMVQSILHTSPMWKDVTHDSQTFDRFQPLSPNPDVLDVEDLPEVMASGKLFARKFDIRVNPDILERVDQLRHN